MKKSEVTMENICAWIVAMYNQMDNDNLKLSKKEEDNLDKKLHYTLEEFFNYPDYKNYN